MEYVAILFWILFLLMCIFERRQVYLGFTLILASFTTNIVFFELVSKGMISNRIGLIIFFIINLAVLILLSSGPILLILTLFYNSYQILKYEGRSLQNFLSLILAIALCSYIFVFPNLIDFSKTITIWHYIYLLISLWAIYIVMISMSYTISAFLNFLNFSKHKLNYIVVLGAGLNGENVTPLLASRIDKGISIYFKNKGSKIIMSGGQGEDEVISEALAMKNYALAKGIPDNDIIMENKSTNTEENIRFSYKLMENKKRFAIVTNYYHLFRALLFARKEGIKCIGYGAKTKFYFSINAFIREFIAYTTISWKFHVSLLIISTLFYLVLVVWNLFYR